jgi:thioredoxin-like negative regulator of GroEL
MSKLDVGYELEKTVKDKEKVFVLFYASWCPFSQRFLPIFSKVAESSRDCARVITDDKASLCEKYAVDTVPAVLVFEKGKVTRRLDSEPHEGLTEAMLIKFLVKT